MRRRRVLRTGGAAALAALAGCLGGDDSSPESGSEFDDPGPPWSRSDAVYHQAHFSGMKMIGTAQEGGRTVGLSYTYAERFWTVTGERTQRVGVEDEYNAIHLMASVWDTETGTVLPVDSGLRVAVERDGETLTERAMWPMLSQQMGAHFGDNIEFPAQEEFTLAIDMGETTATRLGSLQQLSDSPGTVRFDFDFTRSTRNEIKVRPTGAQPLERRGAADAVPPMEMSMQPLSFAPTPDALPGRVLGEGTSGDAEFVIAASGSADGTYLAVSPRTPYNGYVLPLMSLSVTVERDGESVFEGSLANTVGPNRGYHYGAVLDSIESGDEITVTVDSPPQVARHAGYETAFLDMPEVSVTA
ncbi:hypothetical protein SAMN05216226_11310 [Halovenus aranensis]|uniref:DUF7350 domain-containing protein n=1 Tax=Halovenus aranensis TaxID=890420 RepID=A0A1G8Y0E0_9EURY|nr:hypothetical protein [Halovenus aranensis]SDJ96319.1 hypothetical protein SAMN05216226_11310 [Halovenus aranensis]